MKKISLVEIKNTTGIGFGTSGVRGLVDQLTNRVVYLYTSAFFEYLTQKEGKPKSVAIAGDLRESTPKIMRVVAKAAGDRGIEVVNCGFVPTQALAWYGIGHKIPSIMVTGSHIPADRNGIKFYKAGGEVLKSDEEEISQMEVDEVGEIEGVNLPEENLKAKELYFKRLEEMFEPGILSGLKVGVYGHSAVGRDLLFEILKKLGANPTRLGYSQEFIPVDTEVIERELVNLGKKWSEKFGFEAIVSTDGDSDRPLLGDEKGNWLRSDILGILTAKFLGAKTIVNPISCNTALEKSGWFEKIIKTKIGSPYVVKAMIDLKKEGFEKIVGYEANGGFFTEELPTRDGILPLLSWLAMAKIEAKKISELFELLPKRFTESGSVKDFPTDISQELLGSDKVEIGIEKVFGKILDRDETDGLRMRMGSGEIVHLRPSKNAPEFRNYVEADSPTRAKEMSEILTKMIIGWKNKDD